MSISSSPKTTGARRRRPTVHQRGGSHNARAPKLTDPRRIGRLLDSPFALSLLSGLLVFAAFPPYGWRMLTFVAPIGWLLVIRRPDWESRRIYLPVYLAAVVHWLLMVHGIRLAHWAAWFGWMALAAYVAVYPMLFVWVSRIAVHRLHCPLILAAPVAWTGLELARGHLLSGFSMAQLGHAHYDWPMMIQIADWGGAYAVSFVTVCVAAALTQMIPQQKQPISLRSCCVAAAAAGMVLGGALLYGNLQLRRSPSMQTSARTSGEQKHLKAALVQGSFYTIFGAPQSRYHNIFNRYVELTKQAYQKHSDLDVIIWPECVYSSDAPDLLIEGRPQLPADLQKAISPEKFVQGLERWRQDAQQKNRETAREIFQSPQEEPPHENHKTALVAGSNTYLYGPQGEEIFNSVLLLDSRGEIHKRYYKMHTVMFGEYVPLGDIFPWLYRLTPMTQGLTTGKGPRLMDVGRWQASPSICFETTVPHLIRRQVADLTATQSRPDLLINVTNDGWFKCSSMLDLHLACAVFRSVENRLPLIIAANTGFSAHIDGDGRIQQIGPRGEETVLIAQVQRDGRISLYQKLGDLFAGICLALSATALVIGTVARRSVAGRS